MSVFILLFRGSCEIFFAKEETFWCFGLYSLSSLLDLQYF